MGLERKKAQEFFFPKHLSKLSLILFLRFLNCSFNSAAERITLVALQFACPMTQKSLNLIKE